MHFLWPRYTYCCHPCSCGGFIRSVHWCINPSLSLSLFLARSTYWSFSLSQQGSRVRPIWSHVHPNFSRVRLTKIPGRTGASSHSRKEKKVSATQKLWFKKRPPLGLYRGLNQSEIVKGGPPLWLAVVQISLYVCVRVDKCVTCAAAVRQRERGE